MKTMMAGATLALLLTGCSKGEDQESAQIRREPGAWVSSMELKSFNMKGAPPEAEEQMKAMLASMGNTRTCLTAEAAKSEDIAEKLAKPPGAAGECKYTRKDLVGTDIAIEMTCETEGASKPMMVAIKGKAEAKQTSIDMTLKGEQGGEPVEMELKLQNRWDGACTGKEAKS